MAVVSHHLAYPRPNFRSWRVDIDGGQEVLPGGLASTALGIPCTRSCSPQEYKVFASASAPVALECLFSSVTSHSALVIPPGHSMAPRFTGGFWNADVGCCCYNRC